MTEVVDPSFKLVLRGFGCGLCLSGFLGSLCDSALARHPDAGLNRLHLEIVGALVLGASSRLVVRPGSRDSAHREFDRLRLGLDFGSVLAGVLGFAFQLHDRA